MSSRLSWSNDVAIQAIESILPVEAAAPCGRTDAESIDVRGDVATYPRSTCRDEKVRNGDNPGRNLWAAVVRDGGDIGMRSCETTPQQSPWTKEATPA